MEDSWRRYCHHEYVFARKEWQRGKRIYQGLGELGKIFKIYANYGYSEIKGRKKFGHIFLGR